MSSLVDPSLCKARIRGTAAQGIEPIERPYQVAIRNSQFAVVELIENLVIMDTISLIS